MAPSSAVLRPYVWAYGMTTGRVGSVPLVIPLPARPKQLLTFFFADPYCIHRPGSDHSDASPRVTVVGPQTHARTGLSACGRIDNFTIHRSEERRVGKEGRSRWAPYHSKKEER